MQLRNGMRTKEGMGTKRRNSGIAVACAF